MRSREACMPRGGGHCPRAYYGPHRRSCFDNRSRPDRRRADNTVASETSIEPPAQDPEGAKAAVHCWSSSSALGTRWCSRHGVESLLDVDRSDDLFGGLKRQPGLDEAEGYRSRDKPRCFDCQCPWHRSVVGPSFRRRLVSVSTTSSSVRISYCHSPPPSTCGVAFLR